MNAPKPQGLLPRWWRTLVIGGILVLLLAGWSVDRIFLERRIQSLERRIQSIETRGYRRGPSISPGGIF